MRSKIGHLIYKVVFRSIAKISDGALFWHFDPRKEIVHAGDRFLHFLHNRGSELIHKDHSAPNQLHRSVKADLWVIRAQRLFKVRLVAREHFPDVTQ